jgi:CAAX protease family protein
MTAARRSPIRRLRRTIAAHPIASFVSIAFGASWVFTGLLSVSVLFGLVALFGPTVAAMTVGWADGSIVELRHRLTDWRSAPRFAVVAVGVPFAVTAAAAAMWSLGTHAAPGLGTISAIELVIFVLVVGEEIGWRGFLLPRLRGRLSLPAAGVVTGIVWSLWHLPIYLQPGQGIAAFAVFTWWVIPFAVVMAFVVERARFSIVVATLMHGSANLAIPLLLPNVDRTWSLFATGSIYLLLAGALVVQSRLPSARSSAARLIDPKEVAA